MAKDEDRSAEVRDRETRERNLVPHVHVKQLVTPDREQLIHDG
jgi:hypothetical protein